NTHGRKKKTCLKKMEKYLTEKKMVKMAETDFAMGPEFKSGNGLQEGWEKRLEEFVGQVI
ncbi:MAG: hypothetical protein Q7J68_06545, partial [Thermoplasmata archaeon]|nr:hypothetical protein [Thermoplasmata archaeon]